VAGVTDDVVVRLTNATVEIPLRGVRREGESSDPRILRNRRGQWVLRALDNVNLEVRRGERIGIAGGNGAGKTTLLKLIAGMLPVVSGSVEVYGSLRALLSIGSGFYPALSGRKNAEIQHGLLGIESTSRKDFLADVEAFSELGDFFDMPVGSYSPGMMSRLQFAVNTVEPAGILLLDEWLAVADQEFYQKAQKRLHAFVHKNEAFLFASHNDLFLRSLTEFILPVKNGKVGDAGIKQTQTGMAIDPLLEMENGERSNGRSGNRATI
jgi:ABC-type polysaccharide/polyol phosphate transport system ATPase subunit